MVANAPQALHYYVNKALVIDGRSELDVAEVAGAGQVVEGAHPRVVRAAVDRLALDHRLVAGDACGDLLAVHLDGLRDGRLAKLVGVDDTELDFLDPLDPRATEPKVLRRLRKLNIPIVDHRGGGGAVTLSTFSLCDNTRARECVCVFVTANESKMGSVADAGLVLVARKKHISDNQIADDERGRSGQAGGLFLRSVGRATVQGSDVAVLNRSGA